MANTYTQLYVQIVFAVKGRHNFIPSDNLRSLFAIIAGIIKDRRNKPIIVGGRNDHIHALLALNPDDSLSLLVKEIKRRSSLFINEQCWIAGKFEWQRGYGAFSYSKSQMSKVYSYIDNQEKHHRKRTFKDEYIELLKKFEIDYDERYIFEE